MTEIYTFINKSLNKTYFPVDKYTAFYLQLQVYKGKQYREYKSNIIWVIKCGFFGQKVTLYTKYSILLSIQSIF